MTREYEVGSKLSNAEIQILLHIARGCTNREIGRRLHVAEDTIKSAVRSAAARLGATCRAQAVANALLQGWLAITRPDPNGIRHIVAGTRETRKSRSGAGLS